MPFTKKIAAFDLDGTLAESKIPLKQDMAEVLAILSHITKIAVIGGGSFEQFKKQLIEPLNEFDQKLNLNFNFLNLLILPTTGSQRYEYNELTKGWTLTDKKAFSDEIKTKVLMALNEILNDEKLRVEFNIPTISDRFGEVVEERGTQITLSALGQQAPLQNKENWDQDKTKRQKIKAYLEPLLPEVDINIAGLTSVDILPKGFNKALGLTLLLDKLGLTKDDMEFTGDSVFPGGNDYSPLEAGIKTNTIKNPAETIALIKEWIS